MTNFESGGYSIGISCSILIADLILGTDFLSKWAQIQSSLFHSQTILKPIFYLPSLKQNFGSFIELSRSASVLDRGELAVFQVQTCPKNSLSCMRKAVNETCKKASPDVFLIVKEQGVGENNTGCDGMKVEIHSSTEAISDCDCGDLEETHVGVLDKKSAFGERLKGTSCWIGSVSKGIVFVAPSTFGDDKLVAKYIVALPKE